MNRIIYILFLGIYISGCKKSDDENIIEKSGYAGKVKTETITNSRGVIRTLSYEYNTFGKLFRWTISYEHGMVSRYEFTETDDNRLIVSCYEGDLIKDQHISDLNAAGYVISENRNSGVRSIPFWYEYDSNGYLTDLYENWERSSDPSRYNHTEFAIQGENIITQYNTSGIIFNYEYYDDLENTQELFQIKGREMGGATLFAGYFGKPSKKLLRYKIALEDTLKYEYAFDSIGRVSKEIAKYGDRISHRITYEYY